MRVRVTFAKLESMQYTGHLDLHRAWERTIRRAGLPLSYSHGYNPRPKINLASALPLGFTSDYELVDIWFESKNPVMEIVEAIDRATPPGINITKAEEIDLSSPQLQKLVIYSKYTIILRGSIQDLSARLQALLGADSIPRNRTACFLACCFCILHTTEVENASSPFNCEAVDRVRSGGIFSLIA